jgi:hypothetical protein
MKAALCQLAVLFESDKLLPASYGSLLLLSLLIIIAASGKFSAVSF